MFLILKGYDFSDVGSCNYLNTFIAQILKDAVLSSDVIKTIRSCLENTMPDITKQIYFICELIADILHPLTDLTKNDKFMGIKIEVSTKHLC